MRVGNCYAASEALYHILGGKASGWKPMRIPPKSLGKLAIKGDSNNHWYLQHKETGVILDATVRQFGGRIPDYTKGIGASFYPVKEGMSKRARIMVDRITWQDAGLGGGQDGQDDGDWIEEPE